MPETLRVLGQQAPTAATLTTLYTTPAATSTVVSSITICNTSTTTATTYSLSVQPLGAAFVNAHALVSLASIAANDTVTLTLGITLATTDIIRCFATLATVSFSAFGVEKT